MALLISLFLISLAGMVIIPLRHLSRVRTAPIEVLEEVVPSENSIARVYVVKYMSWLESWYQWNAKSQFLKLVDYLLKMFERSAGRIAGETKNMRLLLQERFRVIPRESLYWKQVRTWKREVQPQLVSVLLEEEGRDISNHIL